MELGELMCIDALHCEDRAVATSARSLTEGESQARRQSPVRRLWELAGDGEPRSSTRKT